MSQTLNPFISFCKYAPAHLAQTLLIAVDHTDLPIRMISVYVEYGKQQNSALITCSEELPLKSLQEAALVNAIMIENRSLKFYRAMSAKVNDIRSKRVFDLMAEEEKEHLELFCNLYPGNEDELFNALVRRNIYDDPFYHSLLDSVAGDSSEIDALKIALKEEQACIEWYSVFVDTIREPEIRDVFVRILHETNNHCELISEEYMRRMNMVDRSDQDTHVRE